MKFLSEFSLLNIGNLICCLGLSVIAPFYPTYAEKFDVSGSLLGLIFAINPIGGILSSLIVGKILNKNNQTNLLSLGMLIQSIGMFCYPFLTFTTNRTLFIIISLLGRFISGFGAQTFVTPLYAIITQKYADSINQKMAITEFFSSFGYLCGPVIGSTLYSIGGFSFPFIVFGCFSVIIAIILKLNFEKQEKRAINKVNESVISDIYDIDCSSKSLFIDEENDVSIGYFDLIKYFPVSSSLFVILALCITFTFYYPTYAIFFEENFNIPPQHVGFYMSAVSLAYSIGALTISRISVNKSIAIFTGMVFVSISQFFMGPDPIMNISPRILITVIVKLINIYKLILFKRMKIQFNYYNLSIQINNSAQSIFGFFSAPPYIMALPKITEELQNRFQKSDHDKCIIELNINCYNSLASGLFNAVISTGDFLGPVFSGVMAEFFSFQRSCSFLGLYLVATTLLFLPNLFISKKIKKVQIKSYKEYL